jgi:hypothetical protein
MTTNDPDEIRADIERTRAELGYDVDVLADKVTPSKIVHRQTSRVRDWFGRGKDRVMGVASDTYESGASKMSEAGEAIADAPRAVARQTQGNPLAVGLIALGVGWLVSSLIPASEKEKELASTVKEKAEPLTHEVTDAAKEVAEHLRGPAEDSMDAVKGAATDAAQRVKEEGTSAASDLQEHTKQSMGDQPRNP